MRETLAKTKFRSLRPGARLNLERALRVGDRLDGHIVTGHVDGVAAVRGLRKGNEGFLLDVELSSEMLQLLVPKGSIAIDGTSLTIADFKGAICTVSLIPETLKATNLGDLRPGDDVHIEMDILGKYVRRLLGAMVPGEFGREGLPAVGDNDTPSGLSMDSFRKAGWL
jgi:riboflavin synthase